ncbi:MAG: LytR family transcriptional regulator, partial [Propionibacteriaceae bacterium]|nr:LytR family transcriptional regulator [Propionibacteriaceae bacterium]
MPDIADAVEVKAQASATRRGIGLLLLGLIVPGSGQALAGNRRLGRFALKLWLLALLVALVAAVLTLIFRNTMIGWWANPWVLRAVAIVTIAVGLFWGVLALQTWWLARPAAMGRRRGLIYSVIAIVLAVVLMAASVFIGRSAWAAGGALGNIFGAGGNTQSNAGRYNILLLGSDAGPDRSGVRPDSINVASISQQTGRTVLFGLPRNL